MKLPQRPSRSHLLTAAGLLGLSLTPLKIIALVGVVALLARRINVSSSRLLNAVASYLFLATLTMSVGSLFWIIRLPFSLVTFVIIGLIGDYVLGLRNRVTSGPPLLVAQPAGVIAALLSAFMLLLVAFPFLRQPSTATALRHAVTNRDELSHFSLVLANQRHHGYVYASAQESSKYFESRLQGYPQGWHLNGAVWNEAFTSLAGASITATIWSYWIYESFWLVICSYLTVTILGLLLGKITKYEYLSVLGLIASSLLTLLIVLLPMYLYGFQTFLASYALLLYCFLLTMAYQVHRHTRYFVGGLFCIPATALTWLLATPVAVVAVISSGVGVFRNLAANKLLVACIVFTSAATAVQPFVQFRFGSSLGGFNEDGAMPPINLIAVGSIWLSASLLIHLHQKNQRLRLVFQASVASVVLMLLSFYYQKIAVGKPLYYTYKIGYLAALLGIILVSALLIHVLNSQKSSVVLKSSTLLVAILCIPLLLGSNVGLAGFTLRDRSILSTSNAQHIITRQPAGFTASEEPENLYLSKKLSGIFDRYIQ